MSYNKEFEKCPMCECRVFIDWGYEGIECKKCQNFIEGENGKDGFDVLQDIWKDYYLKRMLEL